MLQRESRIFNINPFCIFYLLASPFFSTFVGSKMIASKRETIKSLLSSSSFFSFSFKRNNININSNNGDKKFGLVRKIRFIDAFFIDLSQERKSARKKLSSRRRRKGKEKKRKEKGKKERRTRNGRGGRGANDIGGEYKISERDEPR